jgi:hypothetical protein
MKSISGLATAQRGYLHGPSFTLPLVLHPAIPNQYTRHTINACVRGSRRRRARARETLMSHKGKAARRPLRHRKEEKKKRRKEEKKKRERRAWGSKQCFIGTHFPWVLLLLYLSAYEKYENQTKGTITDTNVTSVNQPEMKGGRR